MKVIDMHCDTIARLYFDTGTQTSLRHVPGYQIDLEKLKKGDYLLQNFALFLDLKETDHPARTALSMTDFYYKELEKNKDLILPVFSYEDICANRAAGKMSAMLTLEEGDILEGNLDNLRLFYEKGVRMIALTWNYPNKIGYPNIRFSPDGFPEFSRRCGRGLTPFGIELVREMERLGIIIDVSHMSDGSFWDILKYTKKPFAASHSNAAAVRNVCRNLTDDMIRALADRGGVMGLNFCTAFLTEKVLPDSPATVTNAIHDPKSVRRPVSSIEDMVRHVRHITDVGGMEVLGLGSDFDGISNDVEFADASGIQILADALSRSGFSENDIEKIFYKNVMRLYHDIL
ncbi:MAG: dipeptidase [Eubacteriales bacterium]|nr:dipeptidase [Eubacteriales bacterium]